jgi:hypothetical protein
MSDQENPLKVQVGGSHYKGCVIQPAEYIYKNGLGFLEGCLVKRITRYNKPGGKGIEDLQKIKHEIDLLILFEQERLRDSNVIK